MSEQPNAVIKEVKHEVRRRKERGNGYVKCGHIAEHTDLSSKQAGKALKALKGEAVEMYSDGGSSNTWKIIL